MAIAHATLQHLVETVKCKTLFITHYPLVASDLEKRFPLDVQNLHMGYQADTRIDGSRDITFLYSLTSGVASESFGIECGRLAGLPDSVLSVASNCSSKLRDDVEERTRINMIRKSVGLMKQCLRSSAIEAITAMEELRATVDSLRIHGEN